MPQFCRLFLSLFGFVCLASCSAYPDLSHLRGSPRSQLAESGAPGLFLKSSALSEPNEYGMMVQWHLDALGSERIREGVSLYRIQNSERVFLHRLSEASGTWWDTPLSGGTLYRYEILDNSRRTLQFAEATTDQDLLVEGVVRLPQELSTIKRVFFRPGATLVTLGVSFDWKLEELQGAPGARIVSFLSEEAAPSGDNSRDSGSANVEVLRASGPLSVEWRGERGRSGTRGSQGLASNVMGMDGVSGSYLASRHGGDRCTDGGNGSPGGAGGPGGVGGAAGDGGDVGNFNYRVASPLADWTIETLIEAGPGGYGGQGGSGGVGGPGGRAGNSGGMDCRSGQAGTSGPNGAEGPRGVDGMPGEKRGSICVMIGARQSCSNSHQRLKSHL